MNTYHLIRIDENGRAFLPLGLNWRSKKEKGGCLTHRCRNRLTRFQRKHGNIHCTKCMMRRWRYNNRIGALLSRLRERSRLKRVPFDLDLPFLSALLEGTNYLEQPGAWHIDRVVPALGYTKSNVQILSAHDNIAKGNRERHIPSHTYYSDDPPF